MFLIDGEIAIDGPRSSSKTQLPNLPIQKPGRSSKEKKIGNEHGLEDNICDVLNLWIEKKNDDERWWE